MTLRDSGRPGRYIALCGRLSRDAYLHAPVGAPFAVDRLVEQRDAERWNWPGEPTAYLAGDVGVALAELGRRTPTLPRTEVEERRILRVHVALDRVVDLTRPEVLRALGLADDSVDLLDPETSREIARQTRASGDCEGMVVPSVAFLDQPDRWNLVIFADRVEGGLAVAVGTPSEVARVVIVPGSLVVPADAMDDLPSET